MAAASGARRTLIVAAILLFPVALLGILSLTKQNYRKLPTYGEVLSVSATGDTLRHRLPEFALENQDGRPFTADSLRGRMHVASFIFTHCPGICRQLSAAMSTLNKDENIRNAWAKTGDIRLVSYSIDPARDSLPRLREYAQRYAATPGLWSFVRGAQDSIFKLAIRGYLVPVQGEGGVEDGFTHTEMLILVDPALHIRGFYDGTKAPEVKRLMDEIKVLRHELSEKAKETSSETSSRP